MKYFQFFYHINLVVWYNLSINNGYNFKFELIYNTHGYLDWGSEEFVDSIKPKIKTKYFSCPTPKSEFTSILYLLLIMFYHTYKPTLTILGFWNIPFSVKFM